MKNIASLLLVVIILLVGCDWTPPRDNPLDPGSNDYNPHEAIREAWIETFCEPVMEGIACGMTVYADVWDPEGISSRDRAWVLMEGEPERPMQLIGDGDIFSLWIHEDMLQHNLLYFQTKDITVKFQDDEGHVTEARACMTRLFHWEGALPRLKWPTEIDTTITVQQPIFTWWSYTDPDSGFYFEFAVECFYNEDLTWDTSGLPGNITSVQIGKILPFSQGNEFYSWVVQVVDEANNVAQSKASKFFIREPSSH